MAYTKQNFVDGQTLKAEHLNKIEDGIAAAETNAVPTSRTVNGKALSSNITLSASDVGADRSGTASSAVSTHNTNTSAHADIREQISQLSSEIVDQSTVQEMINTKFDSIVNGNEVAY